MVEYEVIGQDKLREVAQWLATWEWPLTEADSISRATDFGWSVIDRDPGKGELFDTELLTTRAWASSTVRDDGYVFEFTVFTSPVVDGSTSEGQKYVTDVFTAQVRTVTEVIGNPSETESGLNGSASWYLPSGALLVVGRTDSSCSWDLDSPDFTQLQRDVRIIEAEESDQD